MSDLEEVDLVLMDPYSDSGSEYQPSVSSSDESIGYQPPEQEESERQGSEKSQGRKRKKNEAEWKRNINRKKRAAGEKYTNVKGNIVPAKIFEAKDCPCSKKCHLKFSQERREDLFKNFYKLESHSMQTAYIFGQVKVEEKQRSYSKQNIKAKENTRRFFLPNEYGEEKQVCKTFFKYSLGISDGRITRALATKNTTGTPKPDGRGKGQSANKTTPTKVEEVKNFINKFPVYESHYSRKKNPNRKYLSPDLDITKMFKLYKEEVPDSVSMYVFRQIFNSDFNLTFHAPITDSCRKCDAFNIKIKAAQTEGQNCETIRKEQELHQRKAEAARTGMKTDAEAAKTMNDLTVISFDLMKTLPTPVISTGVAYYKRQLWTYCFGIHNLATDETFMYMWHEGVASRGPQEIGSCIAHYIKNNVKTRRIIMYSDQCGGQNRNFKIAALCSYMVSSNDFKVETIDHKFLVSGHSYLPNDQDFGLVEKNKKHYKEIYVPSDWVKVVSDSKKKNCFKTVVMSTGDFFSTKGLEAALTNRKKTINDDKVEWLKMQWLRYDKKEPGIIRFKYSNNENVFFHTVDMKKRSTKSFEELATLTPLFEGLKPIQEAKFKDLMSLLDYVPPIHHGFYRNLLHSGKADEDLIGSEDSDED